MKVALSSTGPTLDSPLDPRFGRCKHLIIVDAETMSFEALSNTNVEMAHGAGIGASQMVASKGVEVVITGNVGPNAYEALSAAGVKIYTSTSGTVRDAVEMLKRGELKEANSPTVGGHSGMGRGGGRGRWRSW